jgi:hypothetical protein
MAAHPAVAQVGATGKTLSTVSGAKRSSRRASTAAMSPWSPATKSGVEIHIAAQHPAPVVWPPARRRMVPGHRRSPPTGPGEQDVGGRRHVQERCAQLPEAGEVNTGGDTTVTWASISECQWSVWRIPGPTNQVAVQHARYRRCERRPPPPASPDAGGVRCRHRPPRLDGRPRPGHGDREGSPLGRAHRGTGGSRPGRARGAGAGGPRVDSWALTAIQHGRGGRPRRRSVSS